MSNFFAIKLDLMLEYRIMIDPVGQLVVMMRKVDSSLAPLSDWDEEVVSVDCPFTQLAEFMVRAAIKLTLCATR